MFFLFLLIFSLFTSVEFISHSPSPYQLKLVAIFVKGDDGFVIGHAPISAGLQPFLNRTSSHQHFVGKCCFVFVTVCSFLAKREREIAVNGRVTQAAVISFSSSNSRRRADLPKLQRNTGRTGGGGSGQRNKNVALCTQRVDPLRGLKLDGHRGRRIYKEGGVTLREGGAGMRVKVGMTSWFSK